MIKVYQKRVGNETGDCMRAVFASMFEFELEHVPNFIEFGDEWFNKIDEFCNQNGYERTTTLYNKNYIDISNPLFDCFIEKKEYNDISLLTMENLNKYNGIDGLFFGSVFSPGLFNWAEWLQTQHAVVVDKKMNIVHDPNEDYKNVIRYPLSDVIGCNGILELEIYEKVQ